MPDGQLYQLCLYILTWEEVPLKSIGLASFTMLSSKAGYIVQLGGTANNGIWSNTGDGLLRERVILTLADS